MNSRIFNRVTILASALVVLLSSCAGDKSPQQALNVRSVIETQAESRTASKENFQSGDKFGLWVVPFRITGATANEDVKIDLRPIGNYKDNVLYTCGSSGSFTSQEVIYYLGVANKMDVYGVSPYDAKMSGTPENTMTDPTAYKFAVKANQTTPASVQASDFLSAQEVADPAKGAVDLTFKHRLTRVLVSFTIPETYDNITVTAVNGVELLNQKLVSAINIADVTAEPTSPVSDNPSTSIQLYRASAPSSSIAGNYVYEAIVSPGFIVNADDDLLNISISLQGKNEPLPLTVKAVNQIVFRHQSQYNINVQLSDRVQTSPGDISIAGWGDEIKVNASATKLHRMIFNVDVVSSPSVDPASIARMNIYLADPNNQNTRMVTSDVLYKDGKYFVSYDPDGTTGGILNRITLLNSSLSSIMNFPDLYFRIQGDPSDQDYNHAIATLVFPASGSITIK